MPQDDKGNGLVAAWDKEITRRMEELDSGKVKPVPLAEAHRKLASAIE